jgi:hypothetical protein
MDRIQERFQPNKKTEEEPRQLAEESGKFGRNASPRLSYKSDLDRAHRFMEWKRLEGPEIPEVERALEGIHPLLFSPDPSDAPYDISFDLNSGEQ